MNQKNKQLSLFDLDNKSITKLTDGKNYNSSSVSLTEEIIIKLRNYKIDNYVQDVEQLGLEKTWDYICQFVVADLILRADRVIGNTNQYTRNCIDWANNLMKDQEGMSFLDVIDQTKKNGTRIILIVEE